jgi:4-diphosphocytidyl-2-C-methyl-D-erythritol kinase
VEAAAPVTPLRWPAPAKLNLMLHVTGRRPDGYHLLQTVFQFIDACDWLEFQLTDDGRIRRRTDVPGVAAADDLTVRAAAALQRAAGVRRGVDIRIDKRLPTAAGLGGGSSDAATTLVALNHLWDTGLDGAALARIGVALGADVPIFIHGRAAWAEGVGEVLTDLALPEPWYVVLTPECPVSTREVFSAPELTRNCPPITITDFLSGRGANVCEAAVRGRYPPVAQALDDLSRYGPARLSGTGGSVFAAFGGEREAESVLARLSPPWPGRVARGLNRSPLLDVLADARGGRD